MSETWALHGTIGATCASANTRPGIAAITYESCRGVRRELTPLSGQTAGADGPADVSACVSFLSFSHAGRLCRERRHRAINRRLNHR